MHNNTQTGEAHQGGPPPRQGQVETDSLYIEFKPTPGTETREVVGGLNVDLNAAGEVVGFDIDHASKLVDLSTLETESLPLLNAAAI